MKFLLDTDTCIFVLRGHSSVVKRLAAESSNDIAISTVTHYELLYGVMCCITQRRERELAKVEDFVQNIHVLPFDQGAARQAANIRRAMEELGCGIGPLDTLIAATALESQLVMVTGNLREFQRVPHLVCESWKTEK